MHSWIQTAEEFHYYFCQQTLLIHDEFLHEEVGKHKDHTSYMLSVGGKNITDVVIQVNNLFFHWIYQQNTSRDFIILTVCLNVLKDFTMRRLKKHCKIG